MATTPRLDGPDVSHWQERVDFGLFPDTWRLFSHKASEGQRFLSPTYLERMRRARETPSIRWRGHYHWVRPDSTMSAQVGNFIARVEQSGGLQPGDFLQTDWEVSHVNGAALRALTVAEIEEFNDRLRQHYGYDCVITYSSDWVPNFEDWRRRNPTDALWYANYRINTRPGNGWAECQEFDADVWQWTSKAQHPAISGGHDQNHIFNNLRLDELCRLGAEPPPPPEPIPTVDIIRELPIVREGDRGDPARRVQALLNAAGATLTEDSYFGPVSANTLRYFQGEHGLTVDGICGRAESWPALLGVR